MKLKWVTSGLSAGKNLLLIVMLSVLEVMIVTGTRGGGAAVIGGGGAITCLYSNVSNLLGLGKLPL